MLRFEGRATKVEPQEPRKNDRGVFEHAGSAGIDALSRKVQKFDSILLREVDVVLQTRFSSAFQQME